MSTKKTKSKTSTKARKSKSGAKGTDANVERTSEGVALPVAETYVAGGATADKEITEFYRFKMEQLEFLKEYAVDCDPLRAAKALSISKRTMHYWMAEPKFQAEIEEIHNIWRYNIKMKAENAAASHIQLMEKLNKDYDAIDNPVDRAKMANPLVKASETYLRAAGHFTHGGGEADSQVVINIDLGGDPDNEKRVNISGEKKDVE